MANKNYYGVARIYRAFCWSMAGIRSAIKHEAAFRQELIFFIILLPVGLFLGQTGSEKALLVGTLFLVLIVELLNSGLEAVVDRIGLENHELSGRAKDLGSAAVFLSLVNVICVWTLLIFFK
jgi:diacylglycerol kinase (ATP)